MTKALFLILESEVERKNTVHYDLNTISIVGEWLSVSVDELPHNFISIA